MKEKYFQMLYVKRRNAHVDPPLMPASPSTASELYINVATILLLLLLLLMPLLLWLLLMLWLLVLVWTMTRPLASVPAT